MHDSLSGREDTAEISITKNKEEKSKNNEPLTEEVVLDEPLSAEIYPRDE